MFPDDVISLAETIIAQLTHKKMMLATAESCTGGLIAAALTAIPGSSSAVHGGFVTYANDAKQAMLRVQTDTLETYGAVSTETVSEMCAGARAATHADIAIAVTGIAGPSGGSIKKPVGLVYIGCACRDKIVTRKMQFGKIGRTEIRLAAASAALALVLETISRD